jgi:hypothetical protein
VGGVGGLEQNKNLSADRPRENTLSVAVRECRSRAARRDIWGALAPVSRHAEAALLCLELEDDAGLAHHLQHIFDGVRTAAQKNRDLQSLISTSASSAGGKGGSLH